MSSRAVFLSYRREETRHLAGRIADRLVNQLSAVRVFMDVDTIEPGVDFTEAIGYGVESCDVLIALIGPQWSTITDRHGRRRLDDPNDLVAREIQTALEREIRVIPLLVDGARMPDRNELPESLHSLTRRNAIRIDHETFRSDVGALIETVERAFSTSRTDAESLNDRPAHRTQPTERGEIADPLSGGDLREQTPRADEDGAQPLNGSRASGGSWRAIFRCRRWILITVATGMALGLVAVSAITIRSIVQKAPPSSQVAADDSVLTLLESIDVGVDIGDLALSPDGRSIYVVAPNSHSVRVIDATQNAVMGEPIPIDSFPAGAVVSPEGGRAYVTNSGNGTISTIDTSSNEVVGEQIKVGDSPDSIAVSWEGRRLYVANFKSASVSVINTEVGAVVGNPINVGATPKSVVVSPDGSRVYVASSGTSTVSVIDSISNAIVGSPIKVDDGPNGLALSPDGSRLYVTCAGSDTLMVIDTTSNSFIGSPIEVGGWPNSVAISPQPGDRYAYVVNRSSGTLLVLDISTNTIIGPPIDVGTSPVDVVVNKDGSRVYVADLSGTVSVFSSAS